MTKSVEEHGELHALAHFRFLEICDTRAEIHPDTLSAREKILVCAAIMAALEVVK